MAVYVILACLIAAVSGEVHHINVRDTSRSMNDEQHPDHLTMMLNTHHGPLHLRLRRSDHVDMNFPVFSLENGEMKRDIPSSVSDTAFYQDKRSHASVAVRSVKRSNSDLYERSLTGSLVLNGAEFDIAPVTRREIKEADAKDVDDPDDDDAADKDDDDGLVAEDRKRRDADDDDKDKNDEDKDEEKDDDGLIAESKKRRDAEGVLHTLTRREVSQAVSDHGSVSLDPEDSHVDRLLTRRAAENRQKRSGKKTFGIELLVGIDYSLYSRWQSDQAGMRRYFALMVNGIDMRYDSIEDNDFSIFVRLAGIIVAKSPVSYPWTDPISENIGEKRKIVNAGKALKRIKEWNQNPSITLPRHDHFMVFTDYDIYTGDRQMSVAGLAYSRATCGTSSDSIVEDHGGLQNVGVAAHELGHSLGAHYHDGNGDASSCPADKQHIMTAITGGVSEETKENPYQFSRCSVAQMKTYLVRNNNGNKCLSATARHANDAEFAKHIITPPGQLWSPDEQCKQAFGTKSYYCGGTDFDKEICMRLWCFNPKKGNCVSGGGAVRGTTCGNKKWCSRGLCKKDSRAPAANDKCVHGDYKVPFAGGSTCKSLATANFCGAGTNAQTCCGSCNKLRTNIPGCEWGDMTPSCSTAYCATVYRAYCCKTCHGV